MAQSPRVAGTRGRVAHGRHPERIASSERPFRMALRLMLTAREGLTPPVRGSVSLVLTLILVLILILVLLLNLVRTASVANARAAAVTVTHVLQPKSCPRGCGRPVT